MDAAEAAEHFEGTDSPSQSDDDKDEAEDNPPPPKKRKVEVRNV